MKLVMTLVVRDEADIVDANIRFHLAQGVDHVIATDHASRDDTTRILRGHERSGRLTYRHTSDATYRQDEWVTAMARDAAVRLGADWVINNDADEFWWPRSGDLGSTLAAMPAHVSVVRFGRWNFRPRLGVEGAWHDTMVARERASRNALGEELQPKACHRGHPEVRVAFGNHAATLPDGGEHLDSDAVEILHFPVRDFEHLDRKVRRAGEGHDPELPVGIGNNLLELHRLRRAGSLDAWYRRTALDDAAVRRGIVDGSLVIDRRLQRWLHDQP